MSNQDDDFSAPENPYLTELKNDPLAKDEDTAPPRPIAVLIEDAALFGNTQIFARVIKKMTADIMGTIETEICGGLQPEKRALWETACLQSASEGDIAHIINRNTFTAYRLFLHEDKPDVDLISLLDDVECDRAAETEIAQKGDADYEYFVENVLGDPTKCPAFFDFVNLNQLYDAIGKDTDGLHDGVRNSLPAFVLLTDNYTTTFALINMLQYLASSTYMIDENRFIIAERDTDKEKPTLIRGARADVLKKTPEELLAWLNNHASRFWDKMEKPEFNDIGSTLLIAGTAKMIAWSEKTGIATIAANDLLNASGKNIVAYVARSEQLPDITNTKPFNPPSRPHFMEEAAAGFTPKWLQ